MNIDKKKATILSIITVITLVLLLVGATYAYFQAAGGVGSAADVRVTTYTTDLLTFTTGDDITIYADQSNFADGLGNQSGTTFAKAHLLANSKTNEATANYYVYLDITNNTFEYTQEDGTAELLLQVTDSNGTEVTTLSGLEYKTVTDGMGQTIKGFDVTTFDGLITIANNYELNANPDTTQTWTVKLVFVNLDADQNANTSKSLQASLTITREAILTLAGWVKSQYTTQGANNLYYHDSTLENGANDNSYRYAGASETTNNFVCFGNDEEICPDDNLYRIIGVFGDQVKLIKWDYATTALLGTDGDYKSSCAANSMYCKGTNKGTNSTAYIGAYCWNYANYSTTYITTSYSNLWSYSKLNTVNLNINFLNNIGTEWSSKIAETTWKVGGNAYTIIQGTTAANAYKNEYISPNREIEITHSAKIGLMYTSDYGFAVSPSVWTTPLYNYYSSSITAKNWMYMGLLEWTIVRRSDNTYYVFYVSSSGNIDSDSGSYSEYAYAVRPVFYLNSDITYVSGTGEKANPIRIS